jgi:arabinofuranosyltransferase
MRFLAVLLPVWALYLLLVRRFDFVCDDAYITFQYARRLVEGHGLRFNAAGEPVQGYTDFLWVVWSALLRNVGLDPALGSRLTSVACGLHVLARVMRLASAHAGGRRSAALAAGLLLAGLPPFAAWTSSGLGTVPVAWASFLVFDHLAGGARPRPARATAFAVVACLLRADGVVYAAFAFAAAWLAGTPERRRSLARAAVPGGATVAAVLLGYFGWCAWYFGDWAPQTVRAKVTGSVLSWEQGAKYLATLAITFPSLWLALAVPRGRRDGGSALGGSAGAVALAGYAWAGLVGGDWMPFGRFLVPVLPFLALSFGLRAAAPGSSGSPLFRPVLVAAVLLSSLPGAFDRPRVPQRVLERLHFRWNDRTISSELEFWARVRQNSRENAALGRALAAHTRPGDSIVLGAIGAVAYATDLFVYDRNGLVTKEVTEEAGPPVRRSPGHLRNVPRTFFLDDDPTILQAEIADASAGVHAIPRPEGEVAASYERVAIPLQAREFPAGSVLVLLRRIDAAPVSPGA